MSFNTEEIYVKKEAPIEPFKIDDTYGKYSFDSFYEDNENNLQNKETEAVALPNKIEPTTNSKIKNKLTKKESQEKTEILVNKKTTDAALDEIKTELKLKGVTAKFKSIKRNTKGEIIAIKIDVSSKNANANYSIGSESPIKTIIISINDNGKTINIGNSSIHNDEDIVVVGYSDSLKPKPWKVIIGRNAGKVFNDSIDFSNVAVIGYADSLSATNSAISSKNIFVISDDDKESLLTDKGNHAIRLRSSKTDSAKIVIKTEGGKEPIFIVDGKELTKKEFEDIHPEHVESVSVFKGKKANTIYGTKGKNGVVVITKKEDKNIIIDLDNNDSEKPLIIVDGEESKEDLEKIDPDNIKSINVLKGDNAIEKYGDKAKDGVIEITTKKK